MCLFDPNSPNSKPYTPPTVKQIPDKSTTLQEGKKLVTEEEVKAPLAGDEAVAERAAKKIGAERLTINLGGVDKKKKDTAGIGGVGDV